LCLEHCAGIEDVVPPEKLSAKLLLVCLCLKCLYTSLHPAC